VDEGHFMDTRFVASARLEVIIKIVQASMFALFLVYVELYIFYGYTQAVVPNRVADEIYPLNLHGHVVYLNHVQHQRLEAFGASALFFGAIFACILVYIYFIGKRRPVGARSMSSE
jgi:hypothetical protein